MKPFTARNNRKRRGGAVTRKLRVVRSLRGGKEWYVGTAGLMTSKANWLAQPELNLFEVNSTFYRLPGDKQIAAWNQFPSSVSFVFKMSRYVTHIKRLLNVEEGVANFLTAIKPMLARTRGILVQLPPSFAYSETNLLRLRLLHTLLPKSGMDIFVEFRNPTWFNGETYDFFRAKKWVIVGTWINKRDAKGYMGEMPGGLHLYGPKTADATYVRLHGGKGFRGNYNNKQLEQLRDEIIAKDCRQNFVVFNNTFFPTRGQTCTKNGVELKYAAVCNAVSFGELVGSA